MNSAKKLMNVGKNEKRSMNSLTNGLFPYYYKYAVIISC